MAMVFERSREYLRECGPSSITVQLLRTSPVIFDAKLRSGETRLARLKHLLRRTPTDEAQELWDQETQAAYDSTVGYLGGILIALEKGVSPTEVLRRLVIFPLLIDAHFSVLVTEQRPRALVILAHYFALLYRFGKAYWWIHDVGRREARAIVSFLPDQWQDLLLVPIEMIKESSDS
jgi:hypothetical protein